MGGGTYCSTSHSARLDDMGWDTKSVRQIFTQRSINNAMDPRGVKIRESRDSEEHPESMAIIIALDVTGSMGSVPHALIKDGLPHIMDTILERGVKDPQVLFLAIGDHTCDQAPLQVGQFESSDELLDHWLQNVYLEGHGGGNDGESYMLAWYFAAQHTSIDCLEKRGKKGFLFTIGDEPNLGGVSKHSLLDIMGEGQQQDYTSYELLNMAREKYNVFHIHIQETGSGSRKEVQDGWRQKIQDGLLPVQRHTDVASIIASAIVDNYDFGQTGVAQAKADEPKKSSKEEMML